MDPYNPRAGSTNDDTAWNGRSPSNIHVIPVDSLNTTSAYIETTNISSTTKKNPAVSNEVTPLKDYSAEEDNDPDLTVKLENIQEITLMRLSQQDGTTVKIYIYTYDGSRWAIFSLYTPLFVFLIITLSLSLSLSLSFSFSFFLTFSFINISTCIANRFGVILT